MRKIVSIPVIILILFSGVTVNLAFHYCGGMLADKSISLLGKPASCGMDGEDSPNQSGMKNLCCENTLSSYTFNNNYLPSSNLKGDSAGHEISVQEIFPGLIPDPAIVSLPSKMMVGPPGGCSPSEVKLVSICIFRI